LVDDYNLLYATGISSNNILKNKTIHTEKEVREQYLEKEEKHQEKN